MKKGKVIGIVAIKGGVGKTTVASSLAAELANRFGQKVLLVDANYSSPHVAMHMNIDKPAKTIHDVLSGKIRTSNAVHSRYGVDVIPGNEFGSLKFNALKLKDRIKQVQDKYNYVIIDASPSFNDELLSTVIAADSLIMVSTPDTPTLSSSIKTAMLAKHRGTPVHGIIINKIRDPRYELTLADMENETDLPVIARIRDDENLVKALYMRMPITVLKKNSHFSKQMNAIARALTGKHQDIGWFREIFGLKFKPEEVNREIIREYYESPIR